MVLITEDQATHLKEGPTDIPTVCDLCAKKPSGEMILLKQTFQTEAQRDIVYWRCTPCGDIGRELVIARKLA
jgi:hypothetical protein